MQTTNVLRSVKGLLENIPFDRPFFNGKIAINSDVCEKIPKHIRDGFDVLLIYKEGIQYNACCSIVRTNIVFTIVIVLNKKYEAFFDQYVKTADATLFDSVCQRRELYCHEVCHLIALIRAFPNDVSKLNAEDFVKKIQKKFTTSLDTAITKILISIEKSGISPADFINEHFAYEHDNADYTDIFSELMLDEHKINQVFMDFINDEVRGLSEKDLLNPAIMIDIFNNFNSKAQVNNSFMEKFPEKKIILLDLIVSSFLGIKNNTRLR